MNDKDPRESDPSARGFGRLDPEERKRVASSGGKAAQSSGNARHWTNDEARRAGRKGGEVRKGRRRKPEI